MQKEIKDLLIHDTWEPVARSSVPSGRKVTKSKWVYTIKYNRDGSHAANPRHCTVVQCNRT